MTPSYPWTAKHFTPSEFRCHGTEPNGLFHDCGLCNPDPTLVSDLDEFRSTLYLAPLIITSGSRCPAHCLAIGDLIPPYRNVHQPAPSDGFTKAADIACQSDRLRFLLVQFFLCTKHYRRVELTNIHVHIDRGSDPDIHQDVLIVDWIGNKP